MSLDRLVGKCKDALVNSEITVAIKPGPLRALRSLAKLSGVAEGVILEEAIAVGMVELQNRLRGWIAFRRGLPEMLKDASFAEPVVERDSVGEVPDHTRGYANPGAPAFGPGQQEEDSLVV